ncbi:MAG: DUF1549 and DUF1553 domain-containing protein [Bryobacteraceae bacterium]|nr:DUF1549 and DUF1553 domain-containing protein [Bryobacteraceae bacterium]MDW8379851.1 DUF1553 domain-containing protein [Bryobacterales bacterium]
MTFVCLLAFWGESALAGDPGCSRYPAAERTELFRQLELERMAWEWATRAGKQPTRSAIPRNNFIDQHIFGKMEADGVPPAPLSSDAEFLRRVSLDLTGRIPTPEEAEAFFEDHTPNKRQLLIEKLLASPAYVDQFTLYFGNRFEVTSGYYSYIGLTGRNVFHRFLRDFVQRDRPYNEVVTEMLTARGDADLVGPANFLSRAWQDGDPIQDTWDTLTDRVTVKFLGFKTECISCHHGRGHLEQINLWLTRQSRESFWRMAAFFSRMNMTRLGADAFNQRMRFFFTDRDSGGYYATVNANSPGPRPLRYGGPYEPRYITSGEEPKNGQWRQELARILTQDRQFAKATVNYLWAYMFNYGLVDPPDGWDLARVDPKNPPPAPWTLQVTHPELLEQLADFFIRNHYSIKSVLRLIANSNAYQLSSKYPGTWRVSYTRYFAKHIPRRLSAEELFDALQIATQTETPMFVPGFDQPLYYANQLPDPTEPRSDGGVLEFLNTFGRGDWWNNKRDASPTILQLLYTMNSGQTVLRTFASRADSPINRAARLAESKASDEEVIRELFLATLTRYPTPEEMATVQRMKMGTRLDWISDLQWALLNKLDFIFNY